MTKIHVISDLNLGFNEFADPIDETIPDVDLVILNGNIGFLKRTALYAETLALKYPNVPFVLNLGYLERYYLSLEKFDGETEESLQIRSDVNKFWPKNLHFSTKNQIITCKNGFKVDIFCKFGWPKIFKSYVDWKETFYFKNICFNYTVYENDERILKPSETSNVGHGIYPIWATMDAINERYEKDVNDLRIWENTYTEYKILVTHLNPYIDERNNNLEVTPYGIHLRDMLWITSGYKVEDVRFVGSRLVSNPGRGILPRSHVIDI